MKPEPPKASPKIPDDTAPLQHDKTPAHAIVQVNYLRAKLVEAEARLALVAEQAARKAARDEHNGKPRIPAFLTPYFFMGFLLAGAVTAVVAGDPDVPGWVVKVATIGGFFFGGALGMGPGWRKR